MTSSKTLAAGRRTKLRGSLTENGAPGLPFHILHTRDFTEYAISGSARAGMPKVNREHLFKYEFWLPPLVTQLEAAHKIDLVMEATGRLKASLRLKLSQIANLRQSLLQKAFSGQLT